jgi:tRNA A-37 threonylcarbamoyl transferase component Bud32
VCNDFIAAAMASADASHRSVDASTSPSTNVTVPDGNPSATDTAWHLCSTEASDEGRTVRGVQPIGPKIAEGRDSEIFEHAPGQVLRVARVPRDLRPEARIMNYVREHDSPAPEVFDAGDGWLGMERLDGKSLLVAMPRTLKGIRDGALITAHLHKRLAAIPAPDWLPEAPGPPGNDVLHLDLHPMNIMQTRRGPVVIDWGIARRGDGAVDVAATWALLHAGQVEGSRLQRAIVSFGRGYLIKYFLAEFDLAAVRPVLPELVQWRIAHGHYSHAEKAKMRALAAPFAPG